MTHAQELDFWLDRHNDPARMRMWSAGLMAAVAWVAGPIAVFLPVALIVNFAFMMGTGTFEGGLKVVGSAGFLTGFALVYLAPNLLVFARSLISPADHSYEGASFSFFSRIFLWPGHMTAEAVSQKRLQLRLPPAQRAAAQALMLRLHQAGPNGIQHAPADPAEARLVDKLAEINAIRVNADGLATRLWRREPDSALAIPTTLDSAGLPPVGLVAGGGTLPVLEAQGLRQAGRKVAGIGFPGLYDPALPALCDTFTEISPLQPAVWARHLRKMGAFEAVMVGHVAKTQMHNPLTVLSHLPDTLALHLWFVKRRHDRRSQGLLAALADALADKGVLLVNTTQYIPDHLATRGPMTRRQPSEDQLRDIRFALPMLRSLNELDIGQGLCVKGGDVIALEAMEGTDRMIARAGELCRRGGWTLVKGCDATKDLRFDVPTVGLSTIENLKKAGASCLAVAAGRTIFADKPAVLAAAEQAGIAVFGFELE